MSKEENTRGWDGSCGVEVKQTYEVVGSGRWFVPIWKSARPDGTWEYRFAMLAMRGPAGDGVTQLLEPADMLDLPKTVQVLAATLVCDGCLEPGLRDDLACLEAGLEWLLGLKGPAANSPWVIVKRKPLEMVLDYLWDDEFSDFHARSPEERRNHILHALSELEGMVRVGARTPGGARQASG